MTKLKVLNQIWSEYLKFYLSFVPELTKIWIFWKSSTKTRTFIQQSAHAELPTTDAERQKPKGIHEEESIFLFCNLLEQQH